MAPPGKETNYFGPLTKNALIKFQENYASQLLEPLGLKKGTGLFSSLTRGLVNSLIALPVQPDTATSTIPPFKFSGWPVVPTTTAPSIPYSAPYASGGGGGGTVGGGEAVAQTPTIVFDTITKDFGDADFALSPTSNSSGAFSFVCADPSVATITSNIVTIIKAGSTTITATQAAHGNYSSASTIASLLVNFVAPSITFNDIFKTYGPSFALSPTSNSEGSFSFTSSNHGVATVSGSTVTMTGAGTTTLTAIQGASGNYSSGSKTALLTVNGIDACGLMEPCQNGGTCTNVPPADFTCSCPEGFSGVYCELSTSICDGSQGYFCMNGGTCNPTILGGECSCTTCYFGSYCELYNSNVCS